MSRSTRSKPVHEKVTVDDITDEIEDDEMKSTSQALNQSSQSSRGRKSPRPDEDQLADQPNKQSRTSPTDNAKPQRARVVIGSRHPHRAAHSHHANHANMESSNQPRIVDRRRGEDGSIKYLHREPVSPVDFAAENLYAWIDEDDLESSDMIYDFHRAHIMTDQSSDDSSNVLIEPVDEDHWEIPSHRSSIIIEEVRSEDGGSISETITIERVEPLVDESFEHHHHNEPIVTLIEMIEERLM